MKALPIAPPFPPMEAAAVDEIPEGSEWQYEPKWDGFRCLAFRNDNEIELQSKSGKPLARYFPDVVRSIKTLRAKRFVLDGEIVIPEGSGFSFDELLQRIHPAESRVNKLASEHPALFMVFDLLVTEKEKLIVNEPLAERRKLLEAFAAKILKPDGDVRLSDATRNLKQAKAWLNSVGKKIDGVIAKRVDMGYDSGERTAMQKIKKLRTADCVVGGFRYASNGTGIGSLLLGLYDKEDILHHVGFTSGLTPEERKSLQPKLERLVKEPGFTGRSPGGPSRWNPGAPKEWRPLKSKLVVEVQYDHFTGGRFRHGTKLLRWRPDKSARQCTFDQIQ